MALSRAVREMWAERALEELVPIYDHLADCELLLADIRAHIAVDADDAWGGTEQMTSRQWEMLAKRIAALLEGT